MLLEIFKVRLKQIDYVIQVKYAGTTLDFDFV